MTKTGYGKSCPRLVAVPQRDVARDRDATVAQDGLEEILVHAQSRGGDPCADVRDARELEQALDGAVLAEGAVQDRQHDVDLAERGRGRGVRDDRQCLSAGSDPRVRPSSRAFAPSTSSQRPALSISTTTVS